MRNKEFFEELKERLNKEFKCCDVMNDGQVLNYSNKPVVNEEFNKYGLVASLREVYRHNGTIENRSCQVEFILWSGWCGKYFERIKINQNASERQINNFINKVVKRFNELEKEVA